MSRRLLLVDLSSVAVPIWKMSGSEADPNHTATQTVARVRALAEGFDHTAVCCDSGRSFRKDVSESYKATRPPSDEPMHHQIRLACEQLKADGFPVWSVKGFEADDLIASAVARALEDADAAEDTFISIASADKDLLQLVGWHVTVKSLRDGSVIDEAAVREKFGVGPEQMRDYLTLVGDASDNIAGVKGVGAKRAAELLAKFGTLERLYADLAVVTSDLGIKHLLGLTPAIAQALRDFAPKLEETRTLITLRTDVDIPFAEALQPRVATVTPMTEPEAAAESDPPVVADATVEPAAEPTRPVLVPPPASGADMAAKPSQALVAAPPPEWNKQLEPRSMSEAGQLAKWVHESRQFSAYGTPQAVLATVLAGRELGLQAMASLRAIHIVEGKPTLSADLIRALVINSGHARYFRVTERTDTRATFETQRGDDPPVSLSFTIDEGRAAWSKGDDAWKKSGWGKFPADMLVARASAKLARLVYPDICFGLYTREELEEGRAA
jgi:5'-3' exonuclease